MNKKFGKLSKPLVIASILVFVATGWLLFVGIIEFNNYVEGVPISIPCPDTGIQTAIRDTNSMRLLSLATIASACIYIVVGVSILQKKHLGFILASMIFACVIAFMLGHCDDYYMNIEPPCATLSIGLPTLILSGIPFAIVVWKYKEFIE